MIQGTSEAKTALPPDLPAIFRTRDLEAFGIPRMRLATLVQQDQVERLSRGLYRNLSAPIPRYETIAMVGARIPGAIVCLYSALNIYGIGTQAPRKVWIAVDTKARKPDPAGLPIRVVRFSKKMLYGVEPFEVGGIVLRITSPARTVVDCFRYRNKYGLDVALEALRDALGSGVVSVAEIDRAAEMCRARTVIGPYLTAVLS